MSGPETKILWLPASDYESRSLFDYESNSFGVSAASRNPAGVRIDANTALNSTIVLACVRVLAEGIATLPLHIYAREEDGGKVIARNHPLYKVLHDRPNDWQTSFEWREMQMLHLGIYGQSFNEIIRDKRDIISALVPLHPSRMRVESIETGMLRYTYQEENGRLTVYPQDQIMHIRWMSNDGVNGMVPIELARDAIGLARACEIHGASFFANGARPGLVLSTDNTLSVEAAESLRVNWERVHRGPDRAQKTAVLTGGLKPVEFGNTNQESQFLETRRFQIEEICRLYRVPGSLVGDLSRSNFANIEQQSIDFVQFTLLPWLRRFESAFGRDLLGGDDTHFAEFDTRGLMRGDAAARASYYSTLHGLGVASVNELRAWENLNPVEGGDARFTPLNMQTLENASKPVEEKPEPPIPAASVGEMVAVLSQVSGGAVAPESAKAIMMAAFPTLSDELAGKILAGVSGPPPEEEPKPEPERPAADVGGLVAILAQVKDGSLTAEAAVAALGSVYPDLPPATAQQIVAGVNPPPTPPAPPEQPSADVAGLLAILGQVSQGAVTPEAATTIIGAVFPAMPPEMAQAIVAGAKTQQQPPPGTEGPPAEGEPGDAVPGEGAASQPESTPDDAATARAFCPGASPPDNSCSPANKGDEKPAGGDAGDPEFKQWFSESVAKNDDGTPMTLWRGGKERETFDPEAPTETGGEYGIFVTPRKDAAEAYADGDGVHAYHVNIKNPLYVEGKYEVSAGQLTKADVDRLKSQGYDSIVVVDYADPEAKTGRAPLSAAREVVLFEDSQIVSAERVSSNRYGMEYSPRNERVVAKARELPDESWSQVPVESIPHGTTLQANEKNLKAAPIEKVVSGQEPFRQNYVTKLWRDGKGNLHIVDGHHRVAMYHALGKDMPARVMTQEDYEALAGGRRAFCPGASPPDNSCSPANKGTGAPGGRTANVSVKALRSHSQKVAGGSYVDGSIVSEEFPNGAIVPKDPEKLSRYHADVKKALADRIGVPSDSSAKTANGATTVQELLADARGVAPAYKDLVDKAAEVSGSEAAYGDADPSNPAHDYLREYGGGTHVLKIPESVEGKVPRIRAEENYGDDVPDSWIVANGLKDTVRGTLISDTPEALGDAVRSVRQQAESQGLAVTVKNRFEDDARTGYGAVHMTLQMQAPSGRPIMTEVQFHLRQAYDGNRGSPKDNSHGLYKKDPKTNSTSRESAAAQMLIWSRAFDEVPPPSGGRKRRPDGRTGPRGPSESRSARAFCPGVSPPDNSCPPANKGDGSRVQNAGRNVKFGTVAKFALENMRATGGFSVHPITGGSPTTGYMVSVKPEAEVVYDTIESVNEAAFRDFYRQNQEAFRQNPNLHFGGWVDTNTGKVYFDLSARYENVREAIDDAKATNQLAIWHLDEGREIRQEDYDARRKQGRSQTVGAVRLPGQPGRRRGARLQGDGGGVSGVRAEGDGWQAQGSAAGGRQQVVLLPGRGLRAFCPGASPPDNSCSPANKGEGRDPSPNPPEPSYDDTVITGREDPRGALTGHNREQRLEYQKQIDKWLADRGIKMQVVDDDKGPPSVDSMQAIAKGVELLEQSGADIPSEVFVRVLPQGTSAAYDNANDRVIVSPDLSMDRIRDAIASGSVVGTPGNETAAPLVHEVAHRDHGFRIREAMVGGRGREVTEAEANDLKVAKVAQFLGSPDWDTGELQSDPWDRFSRFGTNRLSESEARAVASRVSKYAATNPMEFVAEVRCGATQGIAYPKDVMDLYDSYLGPALPGRPRRREAA